MGALHEGGEVHVDYMLMPLTAEETNAGGEYLGARYAVEHKDRWIDVNHLIFELQTYDRGYTTVRINGRTYAVYQDILEGDINVRLFIGKYIGTAREDDVGGIQTIELTPRNLITWKEMVDNGFVTEGATTTIHYSKMMDGKKALFGNVYSGGVRLVIPSQTSTGTDITSVTSGDGEAEWKKPDYPAKYICEVILPKTLTEIGTTAFPMLGRNVVAHKTTVKIPSAVKTIGSKAFYGSKLSMLNGSKVCEFTYADKLETIKDSAFENCTELGPVHFGKTLKTIEAKAFAGCKKAKIYFSNKIESIAEDACLMVGDVEYMPRIVEGEPTPEIVTLAPFKAKLWNGKSGYTPGFYKKPVSAYPENPPITILPSNPGGNESTDPDRTPLDLSGVLNQLSGIQTTVGNISAPK